MKPSEHQGLVTPSALAEGSAWREVVAEMPELDQLVWLYDAANKCGPWIGARADSGDGWLWCRAYGSEWWSDSSARWDADLEDADDKPTHWMPLPFPPNIAGLPRAGNAATPTLSTQSNP